MFKSSSSEAHDTPGATRWKGLVSIEIHDLRVHVDLYLCSKVIFVIITFTEI